MEAGEGGVGLVSERPGGLGGQVGVAAGAEGVGRVGDGEAEAALDDEEDALGLGVEFGSIAAAASGLDLHDVLGEGLGEARERPGNDPEARLFPKGEKARDDVAKGALGDHGVRLGEHGAVG